MTCRLRFPHPRAAAEPCFATVMYDHQYIRSTAKKTDSLGIRFARRYDRQLLWRLSRLSLTSTATHGQARQGMGLADMWLPSGPSQPLEAVSFVNITFIALLYSSSGAGRYYDGGRPCRNFNCFLSLFSFCFSPFVSLHRPPKYVAGIERTRAFQPSNHT